MSLDIFKNDSSFDHLYLKGMDVDLHLLTKGKKDGIPLIFIPGITSYSYSFVDILNRIPDQYYGLVLDVRGRGKSTWPSSGYQLNDYVKDLLQVINALVSNPLPPFIIGHSMGARIAAAFASQYSRLVSGLVLVDPPINGPGQREEYPNPLEEMFLVQKQAVDEGKINLFRSFFPNFTEAQIQQRAEEYRNVSREAIIESYESFLKEPFHVYVKLADTPILLLAAEYGDTIRDEELKIIQQLNSRLEAQRMKGVGHMIYKENPEGFLKNMFAFIEKRNEISKLSLDEKSLQK